MQLLLTVLYLTCNHLMNLSSSNHKHIAYITHVRKATQRQVLETILTGKERTLHQISMIRILSQLRLTMLSRQTVT